VRTGRLDATTSLFHPQVDDMIACARQLQCNGGIYLASDDVQVRKDQQQQHQGMSTDIKTLPNVELEHYQFQQEQHFLSPTMIEFWILTQAACVVTTPKSKFSQVAGIWAGCRITDTTDCNEQQHAHVCG